MTSYRSIPLPTLSVGLAAALAAAAVLHADDDRLRSALTLHASFDEGSDADFAKGDRRLYTWVDRKGDVARAGLHAGGKTAVASGEGKFGGALEFKSADAPWIFFHAQENLSYQEKDWSGSVSLWLRCDPVSGLADGYCDPVQLTPRAWNDAAFFLDFNKDGAPRDFRLGAFPDLKVWNPEKADVPEAKRPLLTAEKPGFGKDKWTHVVFTWQGFNSEGASERASAKLYIDGRLNGTLSGWDQQFTWADGETARLLLGLHYVGFLDEFSCFDRALSDVEVRRLFEMDGGAGALLKPAG